MMNEDGSLGQPRRRWLGSCNVGDKFDILGYVNIGYCRRPGINCVVTLGGPTILAITLMTMLVTTGKRH